MLVFLVFHLIPKVCSIQSDFINLNAYFEGGDEFKGREDHQIIDYNFQNPQTSLGQYQDGVIGYNQQAVTPYDRFVSYFSKPVSYLGGKKKKKKKKYFKKYKYIVPLIITALAKLASFIPLLKVKILLLFTLVLFAKKALLVSIGTLILVLYDTFYRNQSHHSIWKDRNNQRNQAKDPADLFEETQKDDWWSSENQTSKINPRNTTEKWKRWWKYYEPYKKSDDYEDLPNKTFF